MVSMTRREGINAALGVATTAAVAAAVARDAQAATNLDAIDALALSYLVRTKKVSPRELLMLALDRAETVNPKVNCIAQLHDKLALAAVKDGLPDGPFTGVPFLLKDLYTQLAGTQTGNGSRAYADNIPSVDSEIVTRYKKAGLVIFGKTTTPELGLTATTESVATGATRNPWNLEHIAGGSSGGAAAAVASEIVTMAHATDGGGSIRTPASCCGLFGLKPSRGRTPMGPGRTEGWFGLSTGHAVTRSVRDSAALLDAVAGMEPGSRYAAPAPAASFLAQSLKPPGKLRIALMLTPPSGSAVEPEVIAATEAAAKLCESLGHVVTVAQPELEAERLSAGMLAVLAASVAHELGARAGQLGTGAAPLPVELVTAWFQAQGQKMPAIALAEANAAFQVAAISMATFMSRYDVVLSPTVAKVPVKLGLLGLSPTDFNAYVQDVTSFGPFTALHNMTGQPAMSVPLGTSASGLPIGAMFAGRYGDEALLFRLAAQLEKAQPWAMRRPKLV